MSKPKHVRALADHEAQAILSNVRISPRKLNLVAAMIRNLPAQRAIATLTFSKRRIAHQVRKTLESAIANAENNHQLDVDRLIIARAEVGRSIVMRRFHARGRGRSARVEKWFSHMKIVVAERQEEVEDEFDPGRGRSARTIEGTAVAAAAFDSALDQVDTAEGVPIEVVEPEAALVEAVMEEAAPIEPAAEAAAPIEAMTEQTPPTDAPPTDAPPTDAPPTDAPTTEAEPKPPNATGHGAT